MKGLARVKVEYCFEFKTDKKTRQEIQDHVETLWEELQATGQEDMKYNDTEIEWQTFYRYK